MEFILSESNGVCEMLQYVTLITEIPFHNVQHSVHIQFRSCRVSHVNSNFMLTSVIKSSKSMAFCHEETT